MPSLADRPELVGFFSYSREDDEDSKGALSALRDRIQRELRGQLGRSARDFRLWQDKEAIAPGRLWEAEIKAAIDQAVFFIPIVTPTGVRSPYCRTEFEAFLAREQALGRNDLIFPILYIRVPALEDEAQRQAEPVLAMIGRRQYVDWREFRHRDAYSTPVGEAIERLCGKIAEALIRPQLQEADLEQRRAVEQEQLRLQAERTAAEHHPQPPPQASERPARDQEEAASRSPIRKSWDWPVVAVIASIAAAIVLLPLVLKFTGVLGRPPVQTDAFAQCGAYRGAYPGLDITITSTRFANSANSVTIEGDITNTTSKMLKLPSLLAIRLTGAENKEIVVKMIDAPVEQLNPGAVAHFKTSFDDPRGIATGVDVVWCSNAR